MKVYNVNQLKENKNNDYNESFCSFYLPVDCSFEELQKKDYTILKINRRFGTFEIIENVFNTGNEMIMNDDGFNFEIGEDILGKIVPEGYVVKEIIFKNNK